MMEGFQGLNEIRIVIALLMLLVASIIDLRKREINDIFWIGFGGIAVVLVFFTTDLWQTVTTLGISMIICPIAIVIWRVGVFGGADAFCLIVLAGLAPMATLNSTQITPFTTLTNAALISVVPIFVNIVRNGIAIVRKEDLFRGLQATKLNKIIASCIGYRAKNPRYSFSIERTVGSTRKIDFSFKHAENTTYCNASDTWVTPGIPYIIYISVGFAIQIFYGDVIFNLIQNFR
jgi:preflagellin peptidase FlaK